jgi:hypothetical protein
MEESFRPIVGYDNYEMSNYGNVINNQTGKQLKSSDCKGVDKVKLSQNGICKQLYVHRLVALAFVDNRENKDYVIHIDEDRRNNSANNLKCITKKEFEIIVDKKMRDKMQIKANL